MKMPSRNSKKPQASQRRQTRASTSKSKSSSATNGIQKSVKPNLGNTKAKGRINALKQNSKDGAARSPVADQQMSHSALCGSSMSSPSSKSSNSDVLDDILDELPDASTDSDTQVREIKVTDAVAGQETSQKVNETDKQLTVFTKSKTKSELDKNQLNCQFYRRVCILYDGDLDNEKAATRRALLDTGSLHSLTFESHMEKLGLHFQRYSKAKCLYSIEQRAFRVIGRRQILFRYWGMETVQRANLRVLEDPPENIAPSFDILLGREHLIPAKVVQINRAVAGDMYHVSNRRPHPRM